MKRYITKLNNDEKCKISIGDVDKSARILCQAMADADGISNGEVISRALRKDAKDVFFPETISRILGKAGIEYDNI
jgi:hypothetical protein